VKDLNVVIRANCVLVKGENGTPDRMISHMDFLDGMTKSVNILDESGSTEVEKDSLSTTPFLLPPNVYLFNTGKTHTEVGLFYRERVIPKIEYIDSNKKVHTYPNFRMPNVVISVRLRSSEDSRNKQIAFALENAFFFGTDGGPLSLPKQFVNSPNDSQHLWVLPLPNMYSEGRMCYGGNSPISTYTRDLRPLHFLYRMICESPFNNDLPIRSSASKPETAKAWLDTLAGNSENIFPYQLLRAFNPDRHSQNQSEFKYTSTTEE
jgi:hypothetical protein